MRIRFTRNVSGPHVIRYLRDDGSETWMHASDYFVHHDLSHYALENLLGYKRAFNGMINAGMNIRDFEDREKRLGMLIPDEAWYAENLANLFLVELTQGRFDDFNAVQQQAFREMKLPIPASEITVESANAIRDYLASLIAQWQQLPSGETLELVFDA